MIPPAFYVFIPIISPAFYVFTVKIPPTFYKIVLNLHDYQIFIVSLPRNQLLRAKL